MAVLGDAEVAAFFRDGHVRVEGAFAPDDAAAMCDVIWQQLARQYRIDRRDRTTWRVEAPDHLQGLKGRTEFRAIATDRTLGAFDDLLGPDGWRMPKDWGALFILFPVPGAAFTVAHRQWHVDAPYDTPVEPLIGVRTFVLLADVEPGAGGTQMIEGSHRVLAKWGAAHPELVVKNKTARRALMRSHPWFDTLTREDEPDVRIAALMQGAGDIDGDPVRVVEAAGRAGDLVLMHPGVLHARPVNAGDEPRFMLSQFVLPTADVALPA